MFLCVAIVAQRPRKKCPLLRLPWINCVLYCACPAYFEILIFFFRPIFSTSLVYICTITCRNRATLITPVKSIFPFYRYTSSAPNRIMSILNKKDLANILRGISMNLHNHSSTSYDPYITPV